MASTVPVSPPPPIGPFTVGPGDLAAPFWAGVVGSRLLVQRCSGCEAWIWGPQWRCGTCGTWDPVWTEVAARGRVFSWIRTWQPVSPGVVDYLPYVTVLVELADAGAVRVLGLWADEAEPAVGEPVEVVWPEVVPGDEPRWSLWWRRAGLRRSRPPRRSGRVRPARRDDAGPRPGPTAPGAPPAVVPAKG